MSDGLEIEVDAADVLAMLDQLGERAEDIVHEASGVTAERIQAEARARVRRATGRLYEAITREEAELPMRGWRVFVDKMSDPDGGTRAANFPLWHEYGTKYMTAQPFLTNSAELEEGPHLRRVEDALEDAILEANS